MRNFTWNAHSNMFYRVWMKVRHGSFKKFNLCLKIFLIKTFKVKYSEIMKKSLQLKIY